MAVDYKLILAKYIALVGECEGCNFVSDAKEFGFIPFTKEEIEALQESEKEAESLQWIRQDLLEDSRDKNRG